MNQSIQKFRSISGKVLSLARPYGYRKLFTVIFLSLIQGILQVAGVTSILPFLALAADPIGFRASAIGNALLETLPPLNSHELLLISGLFAVLMLVTSNATNLFAEVYRAKYVHEYGHWLRERLIREIVFKPYQFFLNTPTSVLTKKVNQDVGQYTTLVLLPLLDSISRLLTLIFLFLSLLIIDTKIACLTTLIVGGFYVIIYALLSKPRNLISDELKKVLRGFNIELLQIIDEIKLIKTRCAEDYFLKRFNEFSKQNSQLLPRIPIFSNVPRYLIEPITFAGIVILVVSLSGGEENLAAIIPKLGVFALAGYRMIPATQLLYAQLTSISTARYSLEEVYDEFTDSHHKSISGTHSSISSKTSEPWRFGDKIRFDNVTFTFDDSNSPTLDSVSFELKKNSSLAIIGESGSGKSTLINLLLGLHHPTSGRILVDETPLTEENVNSWRIGTGYVPQEVTLIDDTIYRNVAFGLPEEQINKERVQEVCHAAQISRFIESELKESYETVTGERGARLSGGQRQRIGLARALYHGPNLLVLDEATSALDEQTESALVSAINELSKSLTLVVVAHRMSTIKQCGKTIKLSAGKLLTPSEVEAAD